MWERPICILNGLVPVTTTLVSLPWTRDRDPWKGDSVISDSLSAVMLGPRTSDTEDLAPTAGVDEYCLHSGRRRRRQRSDVSTTSAMTTSIPNPPYIYTSTRYDWA